MLSVPTVEVERRMAAPFAVWFRDFGAFLAVYKKPKGNLSNKLKGNLREQAQIKAGDVGEQSLAFP